MINFNNFSFNKTNKRSCKDVAFRQNSQTVLPSNVSTTGLDSFVKTTVTTPPTFSQPNPTVKMKVGYINDFHGQLTKMERTIVPLQDCDVRFSAGDILLGDDRNSMLNKAVVKYLNLANIEASAIGNHEIDASQKSFMDTTAPLKTKFVNVNYRQYPESTQDIPQEKRAQINHKFVNSYVQDIKGEKCGVIGVVPVDLEARYNHPEWYTDCKVDNMDKTVQDVQGEVDKLKKQGINKIFLLSHNGFKRDQEMAQKTDGIDVIIGGHSHDLVKGVEKGKNLFASKSGDPVVITQAGKDGYNFGELNIEFNKQTGVLTSVQNNVIPTENYKPNLIYTKILESEFGDSQPLGVIESVLPRPKNQLTEESAQANFVCDAMKNELGADIGILNSSNLRSEFEKGPFTKLDAKMLSPFNNKMELVNVTEKDLVDGFKFTCKSLTNLSNKPGILDASGLKYTVSKSTGDLKNMSFVDREGKEHPINIDKPDSNKIYKLAADSFVLMGGDKVKSFDYRGKEEKIFDFDKDKLVSDYVKRQNKPININETGRITFVD